MVLILFAAGGAAAAPIDDAKKAFAEGKAAFERGDYDAALSAYQRANTILPAPNLYFNIGVTYERLGRYQEAALAFDKYLELAGAPQADEDRDFQEKLRARAEADRKRADVPGEARAEPPLPPSPPPQTGYYTPPAYYPPPYVPTVPIIGDRQSRLREAQRHRTNALVLIGIGVPLTALGIAAATYGFGFSTTNAQYGWDFAGLTLGVVGITLWAPGAVSFVRWNRVISDLARSKP
jgi:tetratricopeptide (TPR) repeat protein